VVILDVLQDPKAYDRLALQGLQSTVAALFEKCVRPYTDDQGGGVVAVGYEKVLGVTMRPSSGIGAERTSLRPWLVKGN